MDRCLEPFNSHDAAWSPWCVRSQGNLSFFSSHDTGGWTRKPPTRTRVLLLSDRSRSTFFFWDRIINLPERALSSLCRPERLWLPRKALPSVRLTHLALEVVKYYWSSTIFVYGFDIVLNLPKKTKRQVGFPAHCRDLCLVFFGRFRIRGDTIANI